MGLAGDLHKIARSLTTLRAQREKNMIFFSMALLQATSHSRNLLSGVRVLSPPLVTGHFYLDLIFCLPVPDSTLTLSQSTPALLYPTSDL